MNDASPVQAVDYFGLTETHKVPLPDGVQWIEIKELNEGDRREHEKRTTQDMTLQGQGGGATMRFDPGLTRHSLIENSVSDWHIIRDGEPLRFDSKNLREFLKKAPPSIIDLVHDKCQEVNVWTLNEENLEAMIDERDRLNDRIRDLEAREEGKDN